MKKKRWKFLPYLLILPFSFIFFRAACWSLDADSEKSEVFKKGEVHKMKVRSRGFSENLGSWFSFSRNKEYFFLLESDETNGRMDVSRKFYFAHENDDSLQVKFLPGSEFIIQPDGEKGNLYLKGALFMIVSILPFWIIREIQTRR